VLGGKENRKGKRGKDADCNMAPKFWEKMKGRALTLPKIIDLKSNLNQGKGGGRSAGRTGEKAGKKTSQKEAVKTREGGWVEKVGKSVTCEKG